MGYNDTPTEWGNVDTRPWLLCESFPHYRGYTPAYADSEKYRAMFKNAFHDIPIEAPQDPFNPGPDEAFCFIEPGILPIPHPDDAAKMLERNHIVHPALDARGRRVILKAVLSSSSEIAITRLLSKYPLRADHRNHTIPVIEILELGEWAIIVTAERVIAQWDTSGTVGEYLEHGRQMFEGLEFMHRNNVYHGDIDSMNLVMNHQGVRDVISMVPFPRNFGPCGAKYAFIDFGSSRIVPPSKEIQNPAELFGHPATAAPETFEDDPVNVFSCDVYSLGNVLLQTVTFTEQLFAKDSHTFFSIRSLAPKYVQLLEATTHKTPHRRPTAAEALAQIERLIDEWKPGNIL